MHFFINHYELLATFGLTENSISWPYHDIETERSRSYGGSRSWNHTDLFGLKIGRREWAFFLSRKFFKVFVDKFRISWVSIKYNKINILAISRGLWVILPLFRPKSKGCFFSHRESGSRRYCFGSSKIHDDSDENKYPECFNDVENDTIPQGQTIKALKQYELITPLKRPKYRFSCNFIGISATENIIIESLFLEERTPTNPSII